MLELMSGVVVALLAQDISSMGTAATSFAFAAMLHAKSVDRHQATPWFGVRVRSAPRQCQRHRHEGPQGVQGERP